MAFSEDGRRPFAPWFWPLIFSLGAMTLSLAPFGLDWARALSPNWLLAMVLFWTARRPRSTPPLLVFLLGALNDFVSDGPIGAETFALLVVVEGVRSISTLRPPRNFAIEWLRVALAVIGFELILRAMLGVTLAPAPSLDQIIWRVTLTVAIYPLIVLFLRGGFGLGRIERKWISH